MGTPYVSANSKLAYGPEPTPGTTATSINQFFGHFRSDTPLPDAKLSTRKYHTFGIGREGYKRIQGGIVERVGKLPLVPTNGALMGYVFGQDSFAAGSPNVHTLTPADKAILPTFSMGALLTNPVTGRDFQRVYNGCTVADAAWGVSTEQELQMDLNVMALGMNGDHRIEDDNDAGDEWAVTNLRSLSPNGHTSVDGRPYMWHDSKVTLNGDAIARVSNISASLNNNLTPKRYLVDGSNGQEPFEYLTGRPSFTYGMDFVPAGFLASHQGTYTYSDGADDTRESLYDILDSHGSTYVNITVRLAKAGDLDDSITFTFSNAVLTEAPAPLNNAGSEVITSAVVEPRTMSVVVRDALGQYIA